MADNLCFATWNVNSIRARENQLKEVILKNKIDVLMLQETKVQDHHFPIELYESLGYNISFVGQKSYNGVAILSKIPFESYTLNLPLFDLEKEDLEARYLEASITFSGKLITFASVYVPNGQSELSKSEKLENSKRFIYKINFFKRLQQRLQTGFNLKEDYIVFGGDYNVANEPIDLFNPKGNEGGVGFHIEERNNLKKIISLGLKDAFRHFYPDKVAYSWWDYRTKAFNRDLGWRLDYLLCSEKVIESMTDCYILKDIRGFEKASDHTLVVGSLKI